MTDEEIYNYALLQGAKITPSGSVLLRKHLMIVHEFHVWWMTIGAELSDEYTGYPNDFSYLRVWANNGFPEPE